MPELKRSISQPVLLLIAVNAIMGTGIFFLPAIGAREAGNMSIIAWALLSVIAIYVSWCFAELASMFPKSGGIYEYSKQAFGAFPSFIIGWGTLIAGNITIAMLIVGAVRYLNPNLPETIKIGISLIFIFAFNYVAYKGMDISAVMLVAFAFITLGSLTAIMIPGWIQFDPSNLTPFITNDWSVVIIAMFLLAETFFGWETVTFLAEETKDPVKAIPRALIWGTLIIVAIVMLSVLGAIGSVGAEAFGAMDAPLSQLAGIYYGLASTPTFAMLVYLSIIGSVAGWIVSAPRLILSLAKDKLFIAQMAEIHPKNNTPHKAIMFQTLLTSLLVIVGSGSYEILLELLLPLVLLLYSSVMLSLVVLRFTRKNVVRPVKAPFGRFLPFVIIAANIALIAFWIINVHGALSTFSLMFSFLMLGIPIYFLLVFYYNPDAIVGMTNLLARFSLWFENFTLPKSVRKEILQIFKDLKGKTLLEFGCGVGTLTELLAKEVGPEGNIIATDLSRNNVEIAMKRMEKLGHEHVTVLHDEHQVNRVHPSVKNADAVFSVGMLSYLQDVPKVLKEINKILPEHGKVCFVEYVDYFWFLPNPAWLNKEEDIRKMFRDAEFAVHIEKKKGLFWKYLVVYGFKSHDDVPFV